MMQELLPSGSGTQQQNAYRRPSSAREPAAESSGPAATAGAGLASSFGEIEFSGFKQQAKFIRVDTATPDQTVQQTLQRKWELSRPTLVINIFGGHFEKKRQLKMIVKKGLWKAAESAGRDRSKGQGGCWIVTGGFNVGIMKLAGEAVRDYTDAYGANHMIAIGVPSWGCVAKRRLLEAARNEVNSPITYPSEETESSEQPEPDEAPDEDEEVFSKLLRPLRPTDEEEASLDSNHTHFFLVETGAGSKKGRELQFRSSLERAASAWRDDEDHEVKVPMCGLLIGGDRFSLEQVFQALTVNRCPIVVVKGTAGAADMVALAMEFHFQQETSGSDKKEPETEEEREEKFADRMAGMCQEFFNCHDYFDYSKEVGMLMKLVKEFAGLLEIFDMEEDYDLDGKMISSLLSSAGSDCKPDQLNLKQLKICLTLNRADIARDKIFLENKKWKKGDLNDFMYQALMDDRHEFVKLLLEQGFSLEDFLTVYILEKLYTDQLKRLNSKVAIFNQLWEYHRPHRSVKKVRLKEVGKVIKVLVGDFYQPLYLKKDFDRNLQGAPPEKTGDGGGGGGSRDAASQEDLHSKEDDHHDNNGGFDNPVMDIALEAVAADSMPATATRKGNKSRWVRLIREQQRETKARTVTLERPARELLIWSLLVGKLQMAELFWAMEKEPIAAALLSSKILKAMVTRTDDFTDTEDFLRGAELFEDRAWGVLDQCYREDEGRAQFLINRALNYYGDSSCIYLAAESKSIKFMAHPCCQDFLTSTWMGKLSPKNALSRFSFGIVCGLLCPLLLPKVMLFKRTDKETLESEQQLLLAKRNQASIAASTDQVALEMQPSQGAQQNLGHDNSLSGAVIIRTESDDAIEPPDDDRPLNKFAPQGLQTLSCSQWVKRIKDFYMAPVIRFVYNTFAFLTFLVLFSYMLLFELELNIDVLECVVTTWILTLLVEEFKQAFLSGDSFATYISDSWNKLDCTAITLYIVGFILRMITMVNEPAPKTTVGLLTYDIILTDTLFIVARICYAFSLFAFFIRLMYIFSFHIALGPKLIMIGKMVVNDLIPFMVILLVFIFGYGVAAQSIAYPTGLYTPDPSANITMPDKMSQIGVFLQFLTRAYFQMFGEFSLDAIQARDDGCKNSGMCPHWTAKWLVPIMLGIYVLLTNILMFNLLIAMFSSTYESIQQFSAQHWNYQRYSMIREYLERSPLAPPLIFIWHVYELFFYIWMRCNGKRRSDLEDPLCISYKDNLKKERELIKWEHMKAMDYLRQGEEAQGKKNRGGDSRSIIVRTAGGQQLLPGAMDVAKQMSDVTSGIGMELEKKFKAVDSQLTKMNADIDVKVKELSAQVNMLGNLARDLRDAQERLMQRLSDRAVEPILAQDPRLEERMLVAVQNIYQAEPPPWFLRYVRQAAVEALRDTPVAVREVSDSAVERLRAVHTAAAPAPAAEGRQGRSRRRSPATEEEASSGSGDEVDGGAVGGESEDGSLRPRVDDPASGRVTQFATKSHRLWRFAPFNFERYPGMRMNVPADMAAWEIKYQEYFAYDASEETPVYPNQDCHDQPNVALPSITFNQYDASAKLRRQSLIGRYQLDATSGAPLNPMGRTGLKGKGLLPRWGPNCAIIVMLTRWSRSPIGAISHRLGQPILQVVALVRHRQFCLPWYLTDHLPDCELNACVPEVLKAFIGKRLNVLAGKKRAKQETEALQRSRTEQIFKGYIDDHMNADNAWIEAAVLNIHEPDDYRFSDVMLKVFSEPDCDEQTKWTEVAYSTSLRSSHCDLLKTVASNHSAYF